MRKIYLILWRKKFKNIQEEATYVGDELLFSFARLFKKDVVLLSDDVEGAALRYFKGGKGGQSYGRGRPLLLARSKAGPGGQHIFSSLVMREEGDIEGCITQLREQAA